MYTHYTKILWVGIGKNHKMGKIGQQKINTSFIIVLHIKSIIRLYHTTQRKKRKSKNNIQNFE